jgi:hypothetical protein
LAQPDLIAQLPGDLKEKSETVSRITNSIPTLLYLAPYEKLNSDAVQDALFCAADILVAQDKVAQNRLASFIGHQDAGAPVPDAQVNACKRSFDF